MAGFGAIHLYVNSLQRHQVETCTDLLYELWQTNFSVTLFVLTWFVVHACPLPVKRATAHAVTYAMKHDGRTKHI